jgi:hypothetical protein
MGSNLSSGIVYASFNSVFVLSRVDTNLKRDRLFFQGVLSNIHKQNPYAGKGTVWAALDSRNVQAREMDPEIWDYYGLYLLF